MSRDIQQIKRFRGDLSTFMVHLTRTIDDDCNAISLAKENLLSILSMKKIEARNTKGLCYDWSKLDKYKKYMESVCFTETPIEYLKYLFDIEGRNINLEPYGVVFRKNMLQDRGANPVFYVNTYVENQLVKKAICNFLNKNYDKEEVMEHIKDILAYIDIFGKKSEGGIYDFHWEREWRHVGDFEFKYDDVVVGLCREEDFGEFESLFPTIKFISPHMSLEEMIQKIAK